MSTTIRLPIAAEAKETGTKYGHKLSGNCVKNSTTEHQNIKQKAHSLKGTSLHNSHFTVHIYTPEFIAPESTA